MRFTGRAWMGPLDGPYRFAISHATPFEQFSLGPGDYRFVVVEAEFTRCGPGIAIYGEQPLTFRLVGFERHTEVATRYTIYVSTAGTRTA